MLLCERGRLGKAENSPQYHVMCSTKTRGHIVDKIIIECKDWNSWFFLVSWLVSLHSRNLAGIGNTKLAEKLLIWVGPGSRPFLEESGRFLVDSWSFLPGIPGIRGPV